MLIPIFILIILFFSIVIHEVAHGSIALSLGDPTAKYAGRLTLNPLNHIDPFGTILLPLFLLIITFGQGPIFGWAKPVPINPYNFRDRKWGIVKVSIAGPLTNFLIATIFGLSIRFFNLLPPILNFFSLISIYNFAWGIFNLIPLPPLDGFHILSRLLFEKFFFLKNFFDQYGFFILFFLILFGLNLIFLGATSLYSLVSGKPFVI